MMKKRTSGIGFLLIFAAFWTTVVGGFDAFMGVNMYRQTRAEGFPVVQGNILTSEVEASRSDDGTTYRAEISFQYVVDGISHTSDTYRFGAMGTSSDSLARSVVEQYPPGKVVDVHYNPKKPDKGVLQTGIGGMDLFVLLFLTPFNLLGVGLWTVIARNVIQHRTKPRAGGVPIIQRGMQTYVRLPRFTPLFAAGVTALGISFISIFIVGFGFNMNPSVTVICFVWGMVLIPSVLIYYQRRYIIGSGVKDLVIDDDTRMMSLPQTFGRKTDVIVPAEAVIQVETRTHVHRGSKGGVSYTYAPTLIWQSDENDPKEGKLIEWRDENRAQAFTQWLQERLGLMNDLPGSA